MDETLYTLTHAELRHAIMLAADEIAQHRTQRMLLRNRQTCRNFRNPNRPLPSTVHEQLAALQQRVDAAIEAVTTAAAERRAEIARVAGELAALQRELAAFTPGRPFDEPDVPPGEIH
jgi:hypothetical protein